jgi:glycosyltransferase involved in cell wall biosynthesis
VSASEAPRIRLELSSLNPFGQLAWLSLACSAAVQAGCARHGVVHAGGLHAGVAALVKNTGGRWPLDGAVVADPAAVPAADEAFAFITGARALTVKLVTSMPGVQVEPGQRAPVDVDPRIFWASSGEAGVLPRLRWLVDALGDPAAAEAFAHYAETFGPADRSVLLLTSVFRGDDFLDGFLDNAAALDGYSDCEHFLIRPGLPGDEHSRLLAHVRACPSAIYINLPHDPGLYETWNLAARLSTARYLSNANLDDRRAPSHVRALCSELDQRPEVDVASAPLRVSRVANTAWAESGDCSTMFVEAAGGTYSGHDLLRSPDADRLSYNLPHCMPLWRRELHAKHGYFDESRFGPCADWEFWLRAGSCGSRFYVAPEPLGVFLRAPDAYWERGGNGRAFDRRIAGHYRGRLSPDAGAAPLVFWPSMRVLESLREIGAYTELLGQLASIVAVSVRRGQGGETDRPLGGLVERLTGLSATKIREHLGDARSLPSEQFWRRLLSLVIDVCDEVHASEGEFGPVGRAVLQGVCIDGWQVRAEHGWLLALARVAGAARDPEAERAILRSAHRMDRPAFWKQIQHVYRYSIGNDVIADWVSDAVQRPGDRRASGTVSVPAAIRFFPDYRSTNVYQTLLYEGVEAAGCRVDSVKNINELAGLYPDVAGETVAHIHWLNAVERKCPNALLNHRHALFLATLRRLRARGITIWWTVHNRLNHETRDEQGERALRQSLYQLADRVYVHHPMALGQLDWLPANAALSLKEHGPYPKVDGDADDARQRLGFAPEDRVLLHFGKIRSYKGLARYIPTLIEVLQQNPDVRVVLLGRIEDPDVQDMLEEQIHSRLTVCDRFVSDTELADYIQAADAGLLFYRQVLTSGALFHMLTHGLPVFAPDSGLISPYVIDAWNGFLYRHEQSLKKCVRRFLAQTAPERARMAHNAAAVADALDWRFP